MKSNKKQRISVSMLSKIEEEITKLLNELGTNKKVATKIKFDDNYFELDQIRLALCYLYAAGNESRKRKFFELMTRSNLDISQENQEIREEIDQWRHLEGFCGLVPNDNESSPKKYAVFINGDRNSSQEACHVLIHETIHLNSDDSRGFQQVRIPDQEIPGMKKATLKCLDEGTCELFARNVTDRLRTEAADQKARPEVPLFDGIPVYEYPMRIVCSMSEDIGLETLGKAYFDGKWATFIKALVGAKNDHETRKRGTSHPHRHKYSYGYFRKINNLSIESNLYSGKEGKTNITHINELKKYYETDLPLPDEIRAAVKANSFNDAAIAVVEAQTKGPVLYPWLILGTAAAAYTAYAVLADGE